MIRILIAEPRDFSPAALAVLREVGEVELRGVIPGEIAREFGCYDVVWMRLGHRVNAADLGEGPRCRLIAVPATGVDHLDLQACAERGVRVLSLRGETDFLRGLRATAELTVALALALVRRLPEAAEHVRSGGWNRDLFRGRELAGKTAGIVGVGRLGAIVAQLLAAFGMRVLGVDPRTDFPEHLAERRESLDDLLHDSDLVSLHVPYCAETRHLIGSPQLATMKSGAVLVNTSRGGVIDETALLQSLASGRLSGAALDVLDGEPEIDLTHPIIAAAVSDRRLLIVPHLGGNTWESLERAETFMAQKVRAVLRGEA